jgi:O-antigen/teichoic acid export membrane protein
MKYLLYVFEQGLVSLLNIGLNIWLIRAGGTELYGTYAFWFNVALLAGSVQNGLTICHLGPLPPGPPTLPERREAEPALLAASLAVTALAALLVAGAIALSAWPATAGGASVMSAAAIAFVPAYLAYQYARALAFSRGAVRAGTAATTIAFAVIVIGLATLDALMPGMDAPGVLLIAALAYGVAGAAITWHLARGLRLNRHHLRRYLPYAAISRWSLIGIVCFELMNRAPGFAITGWLGAGALGRMSATQLPARVPILLVAALQPALRNDLARARNRGDWRAFGRQSLRAALAAAALNLAWAIPVGLAWPLLARVLFHGRFADDLVLGLLWIASQGIGSLIVVAATGFQVCGAFRMIGLADIAGAVATVLGLAVLMPLFGVAGTVGAVILGQACYLLAALAQWHRLSATFPGHPDHGRSEMVAAGTG